MGGAKGPEPVAPKEAPGSGARGGLSAASLWHSCGTACLHSAALEVHVPDETFGGACMHDVLCLPLSEARQPAMQPRSLSRSSQEDFGHVESPVRTALRHNQDFAREFRGLSPDKVKSRIQLIVQDWEAKLKAGTSISLGSQPVTLSFDQALQCLDVREQKALYPLAALGECSHLPSSPGGGSFEVQALFHDSESLVFQFDKCHDRAAFALTLQALAVEARKDKWHEDASCEGWDLDTDDEEGDGGSEGRSTDTGGATPDEAELPAGAAGRSGADCAAARVVRR